MQHELLATVEKCAAEDLEDHASEPHSKHRLQHRKTGWILARNVLTAAKLLRDPLRASSRSTLWMPSSALPRIHKPADVLAHGCVCAQLAKFPKWLNEDCGSGHFVVTRHTEVDAPNRFVPRLLHAMKFQVLSICRTCPVTSSAVLRGVISRFDLATLRVAATAEQFSREALGQPAACPDTGNSWDISDKHKVLWIIPCGSLRDIIDGAEAVWAKGSLHLAMSAPRHDFSQWRVKIKPEVAEDFAGEVMCITLDWVGNKLFYHECLRRGACAQPLPFLPFHALITSGKCTQPLTNAWQAMTTNEDALQTFERARGVTLDEQQRHAVLTVRSTADTSLFSSRRSQASESRSCCKP